MLFTYANPVWDGYFADPNVLRWDGAYYAYGTAPSSTLAGDDGVFPVLRSGDLAHWEQLGFALKRPEAPRGELPFTSFWAPEVVEHDGRFWMYYSAADATGDETHRLRLATAEHPAGPFVDSGVMLLPSEQFTIDAHPFRDPLDGRWYLFFAKDFFDGRVGTGIAAVPLADDMHTASGEPFTVLRASADWQIFERHRTIYGSEWDAWHTVEGPFVVARDGKYYCFYSGGAWQTPNYGVGVGVADSVLGPYRELRRRDGPAVLRTVPGKVLGPGHNAVAVGPDGHTMFMVYHAWDIDQTARRMCIDPLVWTADGPRCLGPTTEPQVLDLSQA